MSDLSWVSFASDEDGCLGVAFVHMQHAEHALIRDRQRRGLEDDGSRGAY